MTDWKREIENLPGWSFGDNHKMADELAEQTKLGLNKATCSLFRGENPESPGKKSYIKNSKGLPVCVIEITKVDVIPFKDVHLAFARAEGYPTLDAWQKEHRSFFKKQNPDFTDCDLVICQHFKVLHTF